MKKTKIAVRVFKLALTFFALAGISYMVFEAVRTDPAPDNARSVPDAYAKHEYEPGFVELARTDALAFSMDKSTTHFRIDDLIGGGIWYSNPEDWMRDPMARDVNQSNLGSILLISYFNDTDTEFTINTLEASVKLNQYKIVELPSGVRVDYTLGERWAKNAYLPVFISKQRFDELILAAADADTAELFTDNYQLVEFIVAPEGYKRPNVLKLDQAAVFGEYIADTPGGGLSTKNLKALVSLFTTYITNDLRLDSREQLKYEHFDMFRGKTFYMMKEKIAEWDIRAMVAYLGSVGYTPAEVARDHESFGITPPSENRELFKISVEYLLDGDSFIARVPIDAIEAPGERKVYDYSKKLYQTLPAMPITRVQLLPAFFAAKAGEQGYLFVPDGSGAIIEFETPKGAKGVYNQPVYGADLALAGGAENEKIEQIYMPVYGIVRGSDAVLAVIESGDAYASITADVAMRTSSYYSVSSAYSILPWTQASLQGEPYFENKHLVSRNYKNVYQARPQSEDIMVRFRFLSGDDACYSGMARLYRDDLRLGEPSVAPGSVLELVGGVNTHVNVLGVDTVKYK